MYTKFGNNRMAIQNFEAKSFRSYGTHIGEILTEYIVLPGIEKIGAYFWILRSQNKKK